MKNSNRKNSKWLKAPSFFCAEKRTRQWINLSCLMGLLTLQTAAWALPSGYEATSGSVRFETPDSNTLNVYSSSNQAVVRYASFNIGHGETVNFLLPNATSSILNYVSGGGMSTIAGALNANGQVILNNPAGILFAATAQVNVSSLLASTLPVSINSYLNGGPLVFERTSGSPSGAVKNDGTITAARGGKVLLLGSAVENTGTITAPLGQVNLAVGDKITVATGDSLSVSVTVDESLKQILDNYQTAVSNTGIIDTAGGLAVLQAKVSNLLFQQVVNTSGIIKANSLEGHKGEVQLLAHADSGEAGVRNSGIVDVSGTDASPDAGNVKMAGDYNAQSGIIRADGAEGGRGGSVDIFSTRDTLLASGSLTSARGAGSNSNAGEISIWSDRDTYFRNGAVIDVRGGNVSGDAGFVEVSGLRSVFYEGQAFGGAVNGLAGRILIDPATINIGNAGGNTVAGGNTSGGPDETFAEDPGATVTYNPQAAGAFNGFGDIHLQATTAINVNSAFDTSIASAGNTSTPVDLTLESYTNVTVNAPITAHNADIHLWANSDNGGVGTLTLNSGGVINAHGGNVTLEGAQIVLGDNVTGNHVNANIYSAFGNGSITHTGGTLTGNHVTLSSTSGNIGTAMAPIQVNTPNANLTTNTTGSIHVSNSYVTPSPPAPAPTPTPAPSNPAPLLKDSANSNNPGNTPIHIAPNNAYIANHHPGTTTSNIVDTSRLSLNQGEPNLTPVSDTGVSSFRSPQEAQAAIQAFHHGESALLSRDIGQNAYVTNPGGNSVTVLDAATGTPMGSISVGRQPVDIAISPANHQAYVVNADSNSVSIIDVRTNTVVDSIPVGSAPRGVAVSGDRLFVANTGGNSLTIVDTTTRQPVATVSVGGQPGDVAVSPDGRSAYVANTTDGTVSIVDTTSNTVTATVKVGGNPRDVLTSPSDGRVFVLNEGDNTVSVINPATQQIGQTAKLDGHPSGISFSADGATLYVASRADKTVTAMDARSLTILNTAPASALPWH